MKMCLSLLGVFWSLIGCFCIVRGTAKNDVQQVCYWRDVIYEDLPLDDNTLIGKYPYHIPAHNDVIGLAFHTKRKLMIATVGRLRPGVPSTLNAFCANDYYIGTSPHLWGFPNYEKNTLKASFYENTRVDARKLNKKKDKYSYGCYSHFYGDHYQTVIPDSPLEDFSIISVYHPTMDELCNRLFVLDTGTLYYGANEIYEVQNPAIIVFQITLENFRGWNGCGIREFPVILRVEIPNHLWKTPYGLAYITLDYQPKGLCDDIFLYITNVFDNSLIVYDYKRGTFWSFTDPSMRPTVSQSNMVFNNYFEYELPFGIVNVALGYPNKDGHRNAYYAPGANIGEYAVSTKLLKNSKKASKYNPGDFAFLGYRGSGSQTFSQVFDESSGVIFFGETQSKRVRCWNTRLPLNPDTVGVVYESDALLFVSEIFIDTDGYLWFHSSHLPFDIYSNAPLDITDVNSRTFRVKVSKAISRTVCDV